MRCFLPCFSAPKLQKRSNANSTLTLTGEGQSHVANGAVQAAAAAIDQFQPSHQKTIVEESIDWILAESKRENDNNNNIAKVTSAEEEELLILINKNKKSTDATRVLNETEEEEECLESLFSLSLDSGKPFSVSATEEVNSPIQNQVENQNTNLLEEEKPNPNKQETDSSSSSSKELIIKKLEEENKYEMGGKPGYQQDCLNHNLDQQDYSSESSSSLFSLSTDYRKQISPTDENTQVCSSSPMPAAAQAQAQESEGNGTSNIIPSVLEKPTTVKLQQQKTQKNNNNNNKENLNNNLIMLQDDVEYVLLPTIIISPEPSFKQMSNSNSKVVRRQKMSNEREVNTSLSSWLVESETTTPKSITSYGDRERDRPILGALTVDDINKYSAMSTTPSSRRCRRSCSPDETPIIGSVGSYWSHTGQSKSSIFRNSGKDVKTKLEAAFEAASVAET